MLLCLPSFLIPFTPLQPFLEMDHLLYMYVHNTGNECAHSPFRPIFKTRKVIEPQSSLIHAPSLLLIVSSYASPDRKLPVVLGFLMILAGFLSENY